MHTATPAAKAAKQTPARAARPVDRGARHKLAAERAAALLSGDGLLRLPEVLAVFPVSASTWWEGVRTGRYPQSIKIGPRCTCWRAADVRALIANAGNGGDQ